jgi:hypothetical protein
MLWVPVGSDMIVIDCKTAGVTVSTAAGDEVTESKNAVIFVVPTVPAVAIPCDPVALLIVATDMIDEF